MFIGGCDWDHENRTTLRSIDKNGRHALATQLFILWNNTKLYIRYNYLAW